MAIGKPLSEPLGGVTFEIPFKLPSLNEYVLACRTNRYRGSKMKRDIEDAIGYYIGRVPRFETPVRLSFTWVEDSKRRDLDNVAFSKKFILDALVKFGKLPNDNQDYVKGFTDSFRRDKQAKVIVTIREEKEHDGEKDKET